MRLPFKEARITQGTSLQMRFLLRVLFPPFLILIVISVTGYLFLSSTVRSGEVDNLQRIAETTAAKLEREFTLRQTVLKSTGNQLFALENDYTNKRAKLDGDYKACRDFIKKSDLFVSAPNGVCESFYAQFAVALQNNTSLEQAIDKGFVESANDLSDQKQASVNQQLTSFVKFFPDTSRLIVVDKKGQIVSQSARGGRDSEDYTQSIDAIVKRALNRPVQAAYASNSDIRQIIFAYPIDQGAVLASYDLDDANFLYPSWKSAPIDNTKAYVAVADTKSQASYPNIKDKSLYAPALSKSQVSFKSSNIDYLATSKLIGDTGWRVIVASPAAIALAPLINTQILSVAVAGVLLVSFMWVGSRFVRRTVDSILGLVGGAVIFSGGVLTHRIDASRMSDKEFSQLAETMNHMAEKIQQAEAAIDQKNKEFISVATHEIKAPITAIIGNLSMVLDDGMGKIDATARNLTTQAYKGTIRLRDLVNELLDIARLESGRAKFDLKSLDLAGEITDMIEVQKTPAAEKGIEVQYQRPDTPVMVIADKTKLEIILTNFISNGIKYNRPQGKVMISHHSAGEFVQITVRDTGLGIPADQQARMFQKFFRVEGSDRAGIPGTGLGMYITKQFIEGMGGKLWFESEAGKGTAFYFTLPLAHTDSVAVE